MSSTASRSSLGGRPRRFPAEGCALIYVRVNLYRDSEFRYRRSRAGRPRARPGRQRDWRLRAAGAAQEQAVPAVLEHARTVTHGSGTEVPPAEARK